MNQFLYDQDKILWALLFFRSNRITKWSEDLFREKSNIRFFLITTWPKFKQLFRKHLFPVNNTVEAINRLEETTYY